MEVDLLDFVEQCWYLVKQGWESTRASPPAAGSPAGSMSCYTVFALNTDTATEKRRIG